MNWNDFVRRALRLASPASTAVAAGLLAALALAAQAVAQPCPNAGTFGERQMEASLPGETRRVQVQTVYFRTDDKNAFMPEVGGVSGTRPS